MNPRPPSLAGRAALAVLLMVGFYLLALGTASVLLYLPYAELVYANRLDVKPALFCVIGAVVILWAIIPRVDQFSPPGPVLAPDRQHRLFGIIEEVAAGTKQTMPADVYLVPEVNAWVSTRGGFMGLGSRRVMGLGLPLLQALDVSELRAVLAHEFGHYHGGDTRLGPWIYKTRAAIGRTLQGLAEHSSIIRKPFAWYANMFLLVSHAISRRQELTADQLAARLYGVVPLTEALGKIRQVAIAFPAYWSTEVTPVLSSGFRPPVAAGFARFLAVGRIAVAVEERTRQPEEANPYDTHPPLHERLAALVGLPAGPAVDKHRAIELLEDVDALEQQLLAPITPGSTLPGIAWDDVGATVYSPIWQRAAESHTEILAGVDIDSLCDLARELVMRLGESLASEAAESMPAQREDYGKWVLGAVLAAALAREGWLVRAMPGEPIILESHTGELNPFQTATDLFLGNIDQLSWHNRCTALGIGFILLTRAL